MKKSRSSHSGHTGSAVFILSVEAVFALFLYMSLAQRVLVIAPAGATAGVPQLIAYQGLLTDASGNPLGGSGSTYCFRYSIFDAQSGGNQLWPSGTPGNSTTTVTDGVFSDELGRIDSLSGLDFESTSTYYLQVQVSTSSLTCASGLETLAPRQQITSDGWAQTSEAVYGGQLKTNSSTNKVQVGAGTGVTYGNQTLLSLDWVSNSGGETIGSTTCTGENGSLWYDSSQQRGVICENGTVQPLSLHSGTAFYVPTWNASGTLLTATSSIFISSSTGNVAIGTTSVVTALNVNGDISDQNLLGQPCIATDANGKLISGTCAGGSSGIATINNGTGTYSITAGTNITISTTSHSTTINAAGGGGVATTTFNGVQSATFNYNVIGSGNVTTSAAISGANSTTTVSITGIIPIGNGGLATTTVPANGAIPIGNGTNYTITTITGTSNQVSVTNAASSITLAIPSPLIVSAGNFTTITATTSITDAGTLSVKGHIGFTTSTPSATHGTVVGSDNAGIITITLSATTSTLTFVNAWSNNPVCGAEVASGTTPYAIKVQAGTANATITSATALPLNDTVAYWCVGNPN